MEYAVFRVEKVKTRAALGARAAHNLRVHPTAAPHADPARRSKNITLGAKSIEDVQAGLENRLSSLGKPPRSNAVLAVELMLTASPEWFAAGGDLKAWANATTRWIKQEFGSKNLLTLSLHLDEKTPHIQALIVPIHEGKLRASHWFDGPKKLSELQTRYHESVKSLGLRRGEKRDAPSRHTSLSEFYRLTRQIMDTAKKGPPKGLKLPQRGILGQVDREDWERLEKAIEGQNEALAKLQAEALAGQVFIASSTGAELARRQAELAKREAEIAARERAQKAEAERIKQRAASAEQVVEKKRAEHDQISSLVTAAQAEVARLDEALKERRDALQLGRLEKYRDKLSAEIEQLKADRQGWQD